VKQHDLEICATLPVVYLDLLSHFKDARKQKLLQRYSVKFHHHSFTGSHPFT
jgi:hypothetical protein